MDKKFIAPTLSIVTPTYNRSNLLKKCYESLLSQSEKNFEWIIIDDGSTDNTEDVVHGFKADFSIQYVKKENGGKHTALNESHKYIQGKYVLILDSDDYLVDTAAEKIKNAWSSYAEDEKIGIVIFLKGSSVEQPSCIAPDEGVPVDIMRYKRICCHSSDCCEVIRSELFKLYPFPVFENERFISEGALWNRVSFTHKCVYINEVIYISEYLDGGLTKSGRKLRIHNPKGGMYTSNLNMNKKNYLKRRLKNGLLYTCYGFFAKQSPFEMAKNNNSKLLMYLCMPAGWLLYIYWGKKYY